MTDVDRIWYLRRSDGEGAVGPFSTEQLQDQWEKGLLQESAEGWKEGMPDWQPLGNIEPFASTPRVPSDAPGIVRFNCECGNQIVMSDKFIGRLAKCKACGRTVTVYDPSLEPEQEPRKHKKKEKASPTWLVPAGAVAGLIAVAAVIIYFVAFRQTKESSTTVAEQDRAPRIARAREQALSENPLETGRETRRKARPEAKPTPEPPEAREPADEELAAAPQEGPDADDAVDKLEAQDTGLEAESDEQPASEGDSSEEKAVRGLAKEFTDAFRTKDPTPIERLEELLADGCVIIPAEGGLVLGKESGLEALTLVIGQKQEEYRTLKVRYAVRWIRVFSDVAVICGELMEEGTLKARGRPFKGQLWQTLVLEKTEGQWRIIQVQLTPKLRKLAPAG